MGFPHLYYLSNPGGAQSFVDKELFTEFYFIGKGRSFHWRK